MNDEFAFLNTITPPPIVRKPSKKRPSTTVVILGSIVVLQALVIAGLLARPNRTPALTAVGITPNSPSMRMTKEQWREELKRLQDAYARMYPKLHPDCANEIPIYTALRADVFRTFGKPHTQHIDVETYWYWQCSDGMIQANVNDKYYSFKEKDGPGGIGPMKDAVWFHDINDY